MRLAPRHGNALLAVGVSTLLMLAAASPGIAGNVFYLTTRPGQCLIASAKAGSAGHKFVDVVSCANPKHNLEVFAVEHGGWGKHPAPANAASLVLQICRTAYAHAMGHPLRTPGGTYGFWPDPGTEQARYGDKVICSYILYPTYAALGPGRHVR